MGIRMQENWREIAQACKDSGMKVFTWSKANNIPHTTCRKWLKRLEDEGRTSKSLPGGMAVWGEIETNQVIEPTSIVPVAENTAALTLRHGTWDIEVNRGFDPSLLKQLMKVVESRC